MNLKRFYGLFLFLTVCHIMTFAQTKMFVKLVEGETKEYALGDIGKIVFDEGSMSLLSEINEEVIGSFLIEKVGKIYFGTKGVGVESIVENPIELLQVDGGISVKGLDKNYDMYLYDISGRLIYRIIQWDGSYFNIDNLKSGVYILKVNNSVFKFLK